MLMHDNPRLLIGSIAIALVALISIYLFVQEYRMRKHLGDLQPDRRIHYLLHQWQLRNYQTIFMLVLIASGFLAIFPKSVPPEQQASIAQNSPIEEDAYIPSGDPSAPATPPASAAATAPDIVLDAFSMQYWPSDNASADELKTHYETALIGAYVLFHCDRTDETELNSLHQILRKNLAAQTDDPETLYNNIISAAEGSYEMVYSHTDCQSPNLDLLEQQFVNFVMKSKAAIAQPEQERQTP